MKKSKKIFSILICLIMMFSTSAVAFAGADDNSNGGISTYGLKEPVSVHNLAVKEYSLWGSADFSKLYTDYLFTGVESMNIIVTNNHSKDLTVKVCKQGAINVLRSTETIKAGNTGAWNVGTQPDGKYFLTFSSESDFSGTIRNGG